MITFAGVPLLLEDPQGELSQFLDRHLNLEDLHLFGSAPVPIADGRTDAISGRCHSQIGLPTPNYPDPPRIKINSLYWPTGAARWSRGLFLATTAQKDAIVQIVQLIPETNGSSPEEQETTNVSARLVLGDSEFDATLDEEVQGFSTDDAGHVAMAVSMFLLPPRPISVLHDRLSSEESTEELWLLPLVDERYYWQFQHSDEFEPETWEEAFEQLETGLGIGFTHDTVGAYCVPDVFELKRHYENVAILLDAVAHCVGQRITFSPDGNVYSRGHAEAESQHSINLSTETDSWKQVAGGDFSDEHPEAIIPASVTVVFPGAGQDADSRFAIAALASDLDYTGWTPGISKLFHCVSLGDTGVNSGLAAQIAADYYGWLSQRYDYKFISVKAWEPTGFDDFAEWTFGFRRADGSYEAETRIQCMPYNFGVEEQLSQCADPSSECVSSAEPGVRDIDGPDCCIDPDDWITTGCEACDSAGVAQYEVTIPFLQDNPTVDPECCVGAGERHILTLQAPESNCEWATTTTIECFDSEENTAVLRLTVDGEGAKLCLHVDGDDDPEEPRWCYRKYTPWCCVCDNQMELECGPHTCCDLPKTLRVLPLNCLDLCGDVTVGPPSGCCGEISETLVATFANVALCPGYDDNEIDLNWNGAISKWVGFGTICGVFWTIRLGCTISPGTGCSDYGMEIEESDGGCAVLGPTAQPTPCSCDPFSLYYLHGAVGLEDCPCCDPGPGNQFSITVTEAV